jgi:MoaE-MoaD fusion protein
VHPAFGALAVFTGHTRDFSRGRRVLYLDYEALDEMTGPEMGRIFAEALQNFGPFAGAGAPRPLRMLVQHRVGRVAPAEPSVLVGVASPHREAAFSVCRFLLDSLKERLPVWKKECYEDGHHWVGDRS